MTRSFNGRDVLLSASAGFLAAALPARLLAQDISPEAAEVYRRAIVFDANLIPPMQDTFPFPGKLLEMMRNSGITAMRNTIGGAQADFEAVIEQIAFMQSLIEHYRDLYLQIRTHDDFARAKRENRVGILLGFEHPNVLDKLERIELFRGLGVRVMQLTYYKASPFGMGTFGDADAGLTALGRKAVATMNEQCVAIDISHTNERTSFDVLETSSRPAIITHAGCAAVYAHPRNKSDALLRAVAEKGGVIGIFALPYLTAGPKQPTLDDYVAHMVHALSVCGEDHVGIGSDNTLEPWEASPAALAAFNKGQEEQRKAGQQYLDRPPYVVGLNTPHRCEVIADALLKRGYGGRVAEKVLGLNYTNALGRIWKD